VTAALEQTMRELWKGWGAYAKHTHCDTCAQFVYCRAQRAPGPFMCLNCWDTSRHSDLRQKGTR
jgi:hypothetical protein